MFVPSYLVVSACPLGLADNGGQCVGEVFEKKILFLYMHTKNPEIKYILKTKTKIVQNFNKTEVDVSTVVTVILHV